MEFSFSSSFSEKKVYRDMELERIIQDTLTHFIQSHLPAADLRYVEKEKSNTWLELHINCLSIYCSELCSVPVLCVRFP